MKRLILVCVVLMALAPTAASALVPLTTSVQTGTVVTGSGDGRYDLTVNCPTGTAVTGGGASVTDADVDSSYELREQRNRPNGNGWQVTGESNGLGRTITVYAICGSVA